MKSALFGIIVFTLVETVTLVVWLILAGVAFNGQYLAVVALIVGLGVEHILAYNVGTGKPLFSIPS